MSCKINIFEGALKKKNASYMYETLSSSQPFKSAHPPNASSLGMRRQTEVCQTGNSRAMGQMLKALKAILIFRL